jgi:hypothetical protein
VSFLFAFFGTYTTQCVSSTSSFSLTDAHYCETYVKIMPRYPPQDHPAHHLHPDHPAFMQMVARQWDGRDEDNETSEDEEDMGGRSSKHYSTRNHLPDESK